MDRISGDGWDVVSPTTAGRSNQVENRPAESANERRELGVGGRERKGGERRGEDLLRDLEPRLIVDLEPRLIVDLKTAWRLPRDYLETIERSLEFCSLVLQPTAQPTAIETAYLCISRTSPTP